MLYYLFVKRHFRKDCKLRRDQSFRQRKSGKSIQRLTQVKIAVHICFGFYNNQPKGKTSPGWSSIDWGDLSIYPKVKNFYESFHIHRSITIQRFNIHKYQAKVSVHKYKGMKGNDNEGNV
ncbi:hypothetical protein CIPAW_11G134800 [Carya illinoinensis]|uniref:Uncharacterized protein n=1 Tax=Carya illinoinensis TaxID=32201 RepID=A0A8T1P266_CARIL|nr:hypothetical protein CIPAW_11G134800 [Carya illinoinensis]